MTNKERDNKDRAEEMVWYVAYGSNMLAERFNYYLAGGTPAGSARRCPGARDAAPARDSRPVWAPGTMYFAAPQPVDGVDVWPGGVSFFQAATGGSCPARAYLVTAQQFTDVWAQETGTGPQEADTVLLDAVMGYGTYAPLPLNQYGRLVSLDTLDGHQMFTFTTLVPRHGSRFLAPSQAYARTVGRGLMEAHGLSADSAAAYLCGLRGAASLSLASVAGLLAPPGRGDAAC